MSHHPLVASMSEAGRTFLARIGRRFGTEAVLNQAQQTLSALKRHGDELRVHGFGADEAKLLAAARDAAMARSRAPKVTDVVYVRGLEEAKNARAQANLVLSSAYRRLRMFAGPEGQVVMGAILEVLTSISGPGGDDRVYAADLERLRGILVEPGIGSIVADSGGGEALAAITRALATLDEIEAGSEPEAELDEDEADADAIDGMIVELARLAQFAARAAAKSSGKRGLAKEFRLRLMG